MDLTPDTVLIRTDDVTTTPVDDDLVMMRLVSNAFYGLDKVGRQIWEQLAEPTSIAALCAGLVGKYKVTPDVCEADLIVFMQDMVDEGLVRIQE
ncbi:MAG: PqqD family peptide modification chaperone [Anaerolineae bacterium]|nr:PqqD family peptide modification chaperone [Anaerolineae bacterium]